MKALLMYRDRDFEFRHPANWREVQEPPHLSALDRALVQDLELDMLLAAMADGDAFLLRVATHALLAARVTDPETVRYRQEALRDCIDNPDAVGEIYAIAVEALQREKKDYLGVYTDSPGLILQRSLRVMEIFVEMLRRLRRVSEKRADGFRSEAFSRLFATLAAELDEDYLRGIEDELGELQFPHGMLMSAELGKGVKGQRYVLHQAEKPSWKERLRFGDRSGDLWFEVPERDESGARALSELRDRGVNPVANALAGSCDHVLSFFQQLRAELGFYLGCVNLHERLTRMGEPLSFPEPAPPGEPTLWGAALYDVCLALTFDERADGSTGHVVGNEVNARGRSLVVITGANQGGKSTFLRSVGLAQLMMGAGMFVGADSFSADLRGGIYSHFKREEDPTMESGKLDEELARMSAIVDELEPNALVLCNESFASTNEREGSEIARQILRALLEAGAKVLIVTHMFDLADSLHRRGAQATLFLRAERTPDGRRTFRMLEAEPKPTSHGEDLYRRIFGRDATAAGDGARAPSDDTVAKPTGAPTRQPER